MSTIILTQAVLDAIQVTFPGGVVTKSKLHKGAFKVEGKTSGCISFKMRVQIDGTILESKSDAPEVLVIPRIVLDVVENNFPNSVIEKIKFDDEEYEIKGETSDDEEFKINILADGTVIDVELDD